MAAVKAERWGPVIGRPGYSASDWYGVLAGLYSLNNGMPRVAFSPGLSHRRAVFIRKLSGRAFAHAPRWS